MAQTGPGGAAVFALRVEESASFLKKRSKKLLLIAGWGDAGARARRSKSFFASFFSKKEGLTYL
jgi:hypothetical protein